MIRLFTLSLLGVLQFSERPGNAQFESTKPPIRIPGVARPIPADEYRLTLASTEVTDLKELARLKSLRSLNLLWRKVADADVKALAELKKLDSLSFYGTKITVGVTQWC